MLSTARDPQGSRRSGAPSVEVPVETLPGLLDAHGAIAGDLACRRCGYNLRGLNPAGRCPECGTPIGLSCHGDLLRFADPTWVETLARGARLILWGVLASMMGGIAGVILGAVAGQPPLATVIMLGASSVGLWGAWLITRPDPSRVGEDKYVTDRKVVRFALLVGLATQGANLIAQTLPPPSLGMIVLPIIAVVAAIIGVVGQFAQLTYFHKLALRIPDPALSQRARRLRWAVLVTSGIAGVGAGAAALAGTSTATTTAVTSAPATTGRTVVVTTAVAVAPAGLMGFGCVAAIAGLGALIVSLFVLRLIYRLRKAFRVQADLARETWAAAVPG